MRLMKLVVALALAASLAAPIGAQDRKPPTFGVAVEMVSLTVTVVDGKGKYVDMPCEGFTIRENGDAQKIEACEKQALPIDLVLLMDASTSMRTLAPVAKDAAISFVRTLRPQDRATVKLSGQRQRTIQEFTSDPALLEKAIQELAFDDGITQLYMSLYVTLRELAKDDKPNERRRVIILLTDGEDTGSLLSDDNVIEEISRHSAAIYPILIRRAVGISNDDQARRARYFAAKVASTTGGTAFAAGEAWALKNAYSLIGEELKMQYRLGYYPTHAKDPGPERTISVMVARANVTARHRQSYVVSRARRTP